jgi:isopentenyl-diphosphate delta-isomerase
MLKLTCRRVLCNKLNRSKSNIPPELIHKFSPRDLERYEREQLILVDRENKPVGRRNIVMCHLTPLIFPASSIVDEGTLHRAFSVMLFDRDWRLLLQRRAPTKPVFARHWANSCCSHPLQSVPGESDEGGHIGIKRAAVRRVMQELGLKIEINDVRVKELLLYKAMFDPTFSEHEMDYLLMVKLDRELKEVPYNPNEMDQVMWVRPGELESTLVSLRSKGELIAPWFELIVKRGLAGWWAQAIKNNGFDPSIYDQQRLHIHRDY